MEVSWSWEALGDQAGLEIQIELDGRACLVRLEIKLSPADLCMLCS
jgi:hypothetical protein